MATPGKKRRCGDGVDEAPDVTHAIAEDDSDEELLQASGIAEGEKIQCERDCRLKDNHDEGEDNNDSDEDEDGGDEDEDRGDEDEDGGDEDEDRGDDDEESDVGSGDSEGDDAADEEEIQVEFEAATPVESDFHGVRALLAQLFLKGHNIDLSAIASTIIAQTAVGNTLKQYFDPEVDIDDEDDEDRVFGVTTCLPWAEIQKKSFASELQSFLVQKCADNGTPEEQQKLKEILGCDKTAKDLGFLINERVIGIPPRVAAPTFESLQQDLQSAAKTNSIFKLKRFVMILKKHKLKEKENAKRKKKHSTSKDTSTAAAATLYANPEEQFFSEAADFRFSYCVASERDSVTTGQWSDDDALYDPWREVVVLPAASLASVIRRMRQEIE